MGPVSSFDVDRSTPRLDHTRQTEQTGVSSIPVIVEELLSTAYYTMKETPFNKNRKGVF